MMVRDFRCVLGPVSVTVRTGYHAVVDYLRAFYRVESSSGEASGLTIDAAVADADPGMVVNSWGVAHITSADGRVVRIRSSDPDRLAVSVRKTAREVLVDFCEQHRYAMLHASAVADDSRVVVIVGDKGSGKTTLALKAAMCHGMQYVSNDHLIVFAQPMGHGSVPSLVLTSLPTPIPVKIGTFLDMKHLLPPPWDPGGVDVDEWRGVPRNEVYGVDERVFYTFPSLRQPNPILEPLPPGGPGRKVLVALATYTDGDAGETGVADPVEAVMAHVRTDWMFDRRLNQRLLPRHERDRDTYMADARRLVRVLADRATVIGWNHHGDTGALLTLTGELP